jgi:hypothetical protein
MITLSIQSNSYWKFYMNKHKKKCYFVLLPLKCVLLVFRTWMYMCLHRDKICIFVDRGGPSNLLSSEFSLLTAKFSDYKSTWSPDPIGHNPTHLSNKMWKNHISSRNTTPLPRPPPGLTNPKPASPWSSTAPRSVRGWGTQDSRLASGEKDVPEGTLC